MFDIDIKANHINLGCYIVQTILSVIYCCTLVQTLWCQNYLVISEFKGLFTNKNIKHLTFKSCLFVII
jgi:hypothetical protein